MANPDNPAQHSVSFGVLLDRYVDEELPELRHSTINSHRSYLENYLRPKWGRYPIVSIRAFAVEQWLKSLDLAPKSKGHIHNLMRVLFNCAMRWEILPYTQNPMQLVRVRGVSKRQHEPRVLTIAECRSLLNHLQEEPFDTMVLLDIATGLRCSELFALKWFDFNWKDGSVFVRRAIVDGVVDDVKTKYSRTGLPLDPMLVSVLLNWREHSDFSDEGDWVFASPAHGGSQPFRPWGVQQRHLRPAGLRAGIGPVGWHTLRHTFSSLLRANGEDVKVQQELLRHADIRTTMNIYTQAVSDQKRSAQSKVVRMMLSPEQREETSQASVQAEVGS